MPNLVNRKQLNTTLENRLSELFDQLSKDTRINKSKLADEAIEDLLKKYGVDTQGGSK